MKLLLSGDLHLGRASSRLPPEWAEDARTLRAWERLVDFALREPVDALLLSGDLIDESNRFWEAIGPLEAGLHRLATAGIPTLAVAGNHDAEILPLLARRMPPDTFRLLGQGGRWETHLLSHQGRPALRVLGWSFPAPVVRQDPTHDFPTLPHDGLPSIALLHGDPDNPSSPYAPLQSTRLRSLPLTGCLLGHIHTPSLAEGTPWILMPGSPQPLDPGEPGPHHAWLWDTSLPSPRPVAPSPFAYLSHDITLSPDTPPSRSLLLDALQRIAPSSRSLLRLRLLGETQHPEALREALDGLTEWRSPSLAIERVLNLVRPAINLEAARQAGPVPRLLADALLSPPPDLLRRLHDARQRVLAQREFKDLPPPTSPDDPTPLLRSLLATLLRDDAP